MGRAPWTAAIFVLGECGTNRRVCETAWNWLRTGECWRVMGNSQGRDNVKKRAARRKKTERLAAAKAKKEKAAR